MTIKVRAITKVQLTHFFPMHPFLYPLETPENLFLCFQEGRERVH